MPKFKLINGKHYAGQGTRLIEGKQIPGNLKKYNPGDIVESDQDLIAKFPGKFELVPEERKPVQATSSQQLVREGAVKPTRNLDNLSVDQLKELAAAEEVDVSKLNTKAELIKALK